MNIKIYSTPTCFYCEQMKELCRRAEVEYELIDVGKDIFRPVGIRILWKGIKHIGFFILALRSSPAEFEVA